MGKVVHILTPVSCCTAAVQHGLQRRVVAVTLGRFASAAATVVSAASLVIPFGGLQELCALASGLCGVVAVADDL